MASGKGGGCLPGYSETRDQRVSLRLRERTVAQRHSGIQRRGLADAPGLRRGSWGPYRGQREGLWSPLRLRKRARNPPGIRRTAGTRKGLSVPLGSLGSPSPGLPGPAGPGGLQAQLQASCLPQASHPGLPGRAPSRSPASAPRRPQLRDASEPSGPASRRPLRPDASLGSVRRRPTRLPPRPPGLFQARPVNNTRTCRPAPVAIGTLGILRGREGRREAAPGGGPGGGVLTRLEPEGTFISLRGKGLSQGSHLHGGREPGFGVRSRPGWELELLGLREE